MPASRFRSGAHRVRGLRPTHLGGELGKLLKVEVGVLLGLLGVYDHGLVLVRQLARHARVFVRLIRAVRLGRDALQNVSMDGLPSLRGLPRKAGSVIVDTLCIMTGHECLQEVEMIYLSFLRRDGRQILLRRLQLLSQRHRG
jgi:hypothetical protein